MHSSDNSVPTSSIHSLSHIFWKKPYKFKTFLEFISKLLFLLSLTHLPIGKYVRQGNVYAHARFLFAFSYCLCCLIWGWIKCHWTIVHVSYLLRWALRFLITCLMKASTFLLRLLYNFNMLTQGMPLPHHKSCSEVKSTAYYRISLFEDELRQTVQGCDDCHTASLSSLWLDVLYPAQTFCHCWLHA